MKFEYVKGLVLLLWFCVFASSMAAAQGYDDKVEKDRRPEIRAGQVPPDFTAATVNGEEFTLSELAGVKPVVLDFWATWCGPCRRELPLLDEFTRLYADQVAVYCITSEEASSRDAIVQFFEENEYTMGLVHDPSGDIADSYYVTGIPYLVVIGLDGTVVATHLGYNENTVEELAEDLGLPYPPESEED